MLFTTALALVLALGTQATPVPQADLSGTTDTIRIHPNGDERYCLDAAGGLPATYPGNWNSWSTNVQLWECNDNPQQKWLVRGGSGARTTVSISRPGVQGEYCLTLGTTNGEVPTVSACKSRAGAFQGFILEGGTIRRAAPSDTQTCLDVANGGHWNGNKVQGWQCYAGNSNQQFTYTYLAHTA